MGLKGPLHDYPPDKNQDEAGSKPKPLPAKGRFE
jgi:hypothetical protein